jgi:hypothetical protein
MRCHHPTWRISANFNPTAQTQGPVPAMPGHNLTRLPPQLLTKLRGCREDTRRLVAWEQEIALNCYMSISLNNCIIAQPSSNSHYTCHLLSTLSYPIISPASRSSARSPPALTTAFSAAWLNLRRFSTASLSRRALVLLLPEGATPVNSFSLSCGV